MNNFLPRSARTLQKAGARSMHQIEWHRIRQKSTHIVKAISHRELSYYATTISDFAFPVFCCLLLSHFFSSAATDRVPRPLRWLQGQELYHLRTNHPQFLGLKNSDFFIRVYMFEYIVSKCNFKKTRNAIIPDYLQYADKKRGRFTIIGSNDVIFHNFSFDVPFRIKTTSHSSVYGQYLIHNILMN